MNSLTLTCGSKWFCIVSVNEKEEHVAHAYQPSRAGARAWVYLEGSPTALEALDGSFSRSWEVLVITEVTMEAAIASDNRRICQGDEGEFVCVAHARAQGGGGADRTNG